ncbi:ABC transporter, putative [Eimeria tenella]|uniref:ABC transporter, putative n=1 Tax=Eimeria tenella TaxID=5802 RepID=U6KRM3_EIMTE|nr:ABC transporter, putative [Eimeria tenella]CDJ40621.1 ABC transporter, putative [Eimeria tenella]|eukprot:XP_013231371.1 ABC transporter, putative [Eimeria tenella]
MAFSPSCGAAAVFGACPGPLQGLGGRGRPSIPSWRFAHRLCAVPSAAKSPATYATAWTVYPQGLFGCAHQPPARFAACLSTLASSSSSSSSSSSPSKPCGNQQGGSGEPRAACSGSESSSSSGSKSSSVNDSRDDSKASSSSKSKHSEMPGHGEANEKAAKLWGLLSAALWPASSPLKMRVLAAVVSLIAAKCLTIAAPVALAGLVDHFTQAAAAGAQAGIAAHAAPAAAAAAASAAAEGIAAATGTTGITGAASLFHPALPVGLVVSYPLARLGASAFTELRTALFARVSQRASRELALKSFSHMHAISFSSNNKIGEMTAVLTRGTKAISLLLNVLLFQVVPTSLEFLMVLALLKLRVGWTVAATAVGTISAYWAFTAAITTRRAKLRREMNRLEGLSAGLLVDSLANAEAVRYFTAEAYEAQRFGSVQRQLEDQMTKVNESLAFLNFGQQLIFTTGLSLALLHTASLVASGAAPVGQIILVSTLLLQLAIPLNFIGTAYRELTLNTIDLEKLQQLLKMRPLVRDPHNPVVFQLHGGAIEFKDVKFAYPPSHSLDQLSGQQRPYKKHMGEDSQDSSASRGVGKLVLDGFSLEVPAGRRVALVGESGSGKTTLIRLLYRLADPLSGVVSIDGQDLKTLPAMSFRRHIGVVPQDVLLFNESLGFNLRYGSPNATDEQVKEAIRLAELTELVESLPSGLDTPVGDRGVRLSGGEKQRVGIARCLLRNPEIVVFDEATSALDMHTEHKILKAMRAISHGRTTLVIAHRLSTVAGADTIAVLDQGRVAEIGTHAELLQKKDGLYASMWDRQREGQLGRVLSRD